MPVIRAEMIVAVCSASALIRRACWCNSNALLVPTVIISAQTFIILSDLAAFAQRTLSLDRYGWAIDVELAP